MSLHRVLAAVSIVVLLGVAGCESAEPTPKMPPASASSAPEPTQAPSIDPLALPAAAREATTEGAEVLIRHFWDMVNHLIATGDANPVRRLYGPGCEFCQSGVDTYELILGQGHTLEGGEESVVRIRASMLDGNDGVPSVYAEVTVKSTPQVERDTSGRVINRLPSGSSVKGYFLAYQDGRWAITNVENPER